MMNEKLEVKISSMYDAPISAEEAKEAVKNLTEFFNILIEVDQRNKRGKSA